MYKYSVIKKTLVSVNGDPSWPKVDYKFEEYKVMNFQVPVRTGDYIDGMKVIAINHEEKATQVIIDGRNIFKGI